MSPASRAAADTILVAKTRTEVGPLGPITVIGDSVLLGSELWAPTLDDQLVARGWGPIKVRTGVGLSTGNTNVQSQSKASYWIQQWRSEGWDPVHVVVNLGANDSAACAGNFQCSYDSIMHVVNAIGPGHQIWWPKITRHPVLEHHQHAWNAALDQVVAERDDFSTWDWPAAIAQYNIPMASDFTHSTVSGYRTRSILMADDITSLYSRATRSGPDAPLPAAIGPASEYVPLDPERITDTRDDTPGVLAAGGTLRVELADHVPTGTTAVAVNVTTTATSEPGFLTAYPCDRDVPTASNVNHGPGTSRGALAVVPIAADGSLCVFSRAAGHVIVDLQGAFVPPGGDGVRFTPLDPPERLLDTRDDGRAAVNVLEAPAGAAAVAITLTATGASAPGFLKAYPCDGQVPPVSNVNYLADESIAGAAYVPVGDTGTFCIEALNAVDTIVDITGTFSAGGALQFVPAAPSRVLDTRDGTGGWTPIHGARQRLDVRAVPAGAAAVTGTLTLVAPTRPGFLTAFPCTDEPSTSTVNALAGDVLANSVTVGVDADGRVCVTSLTTTHSLLDVTGWWTS